MVNQSKIHVQPLVAILLRLMEECGLKEAELARQTGLAQTTINRLLLGGTSDPRANTLKPIADFFGVTIGELCGFETLSPHRIPGTTNVTNRAAWSSLPIIDWDKVQSWPFYRNQITPLNYKQWITTERMISDEAFALPSLASMAPRFRKGSLLIVDPKAAYKDGHYIIVALDGVSPTVRKVLIDGADVLLKGFEPLQMPTKLHKSHVIYGTIVESRIDTYNV